MKTQNGYLLISLDFELFWGLFDVKTTSNYHTNLKNVREVIPRLVALADQYNITLTFATVGFLFAKNKQELLSALPSEKPTYLNSRFNPYNLIENIGENETDDPFHYAESLIEFIRTNGNHEIASHTFSHYYANEDGQTPDQFEADIIAAVQIAKQKNINIKSIVFPRNQINEAYLKICAKHGIICYRGIENHWMFDTHDTKKLDNATHKAFRLTDAYCNVSGYNTYSISHLKNRHGILNIPSSKFFRPYSNNFKLLEPTLWAFYTELAFKMVNEGTASLFVIYCDGKPIGITFSYHFDSILVESLTVFDIDFYRYNIGHTTIMKMLDWSFNNGIEIFDYTQGDFDYKKRWSDDRYQTYYHILYDSNSLKSRLTASFLEKYFNFKREFRDRKYSTKVHNLKHQLLGGNKNKAVLLETYKIEVLPDAFTMEPRIAQIDLDAELYVSQRKALYDYLYMNPEPAKDLTVYQYENDSLLVKTKNGFLKIVRDEA